MSNKSTLDGSLTPRERAIIGHHERLHIAYARAQGFMTILEHQEALVRIAAFESGDDIASPDGKTDVTVNPELR